MIRQPLSPSTDPKQKALNSKKYKNDTSLLVTLLPMLEEPKRTTKESFKKKQVLSLVLSLLMNMKNQQRSKDQLSIKLSERRNRQSSKINRMGITSMSSPLRTFIQRNSMSFSLERHSNAIQSSRIAR